MTVTTHANNTDTPLGLTNAGQWLFPVEAGFPLWEHVVSYLERWQTSKGLIPTQVTVVLPFVQLLAPLRNAWCAQQNSGFLPRFETTQTWGARLGGLHLPGAGPSGDLTLDHLQAKTWLQKLDSGQMQELSGALVEPLVAIANELVQAAGALTLEERAAYWQNAQDIAHQPQPGIAGVEAALGPLAVAWAQATEGWASDVLFAQAKISTQSSQAAPSALVVIQAGGLDALTQNLFAQWSSAQRLLINLDAFIADAEPDRADTYTGAFDPLTHIAREHPPAWQIASGAEDEAERAAAQVISLLNAGVAPVALCSQDRPIARRVWALLNRQNIPMADETGWTLSTTRSAALVMGIVRSAALWDATPDVMLDAFKALPEASTFTKGLDTLEVCLRKMPTSGWPADASPYWSSSAQHMLERINTLTAQLRGEGQRSLWGHLQTLNQVLRTCQGWGTLQGDEAGREVLQTLHFYELDVAQQDLTPDEQGQLPLISAIPPVTQQSAFAQNAQNTLMSYTEFTHWVRQTLETVTFIPPAPAQPQVVLTPLARVMLRPFAAVVIPGCDDSRLTAPPSLPGFWRETDRIALGLMSRSRWWQRLQAQWAQVLRMPRVTLLWRSAEGSQPLGPASLVQRVIGQQGELQNEQQEQRELKALQFEPTYAPAPQPGTRFTRSGVNTISASAYHTLRECPYQYYALYMLQLREQDELESELSRRDYGNWLHAVLREFHMTRAQKRSLSTPQVDAQLLETCAQTHAQTLDEASIIPWQARWPALKASYLHWLHQYEREGGQFVNAEFSMRHALSDTVTLQGRIDRLDQQKGVPVFIDYKTERRKRTELRVKDAYEDVQLPFYALLAQGEITERIGGTVSTEEGKRESAQTAQITQNIAHAENARAFYLSLDDREEQTKVIEQEALQEVSVALAQGITSDLQRLANGFPAYPIGQAQTCVYCPVKGLCRKNYWENNAGISPTTKDI